MINFAQVQVEDPGLRAGEGDPATAGLTGGTPPWREAKGGVLQRSHIKT